MKKSETGRFFMMNSFIDFPEDNKNKDHCFILRNSPYGTEKYFCQLQWISTMLNCGCSMP